ncbi:MAG: glutamate--cysteine ligase [Pseudomonadota bacterium]
MKQSSNNALDIPCLASHCLESLHHLEEQLLSSQAVIEAWLRDQWRNTSPPFYASVDLRNAGFKLAPVDTNLFPAGFNNLKEDFIPLAVQAAQETLDRLAPGCRRLLLVPENHTRNQFYFENLIALHDILIQAGFEVRIGSLLEDIGDTKEIVLPSGRSLLLEKIKRQDQQLSVDNFSPCLIVLNNDLASGVPEVLKNIKQKILPTTELGWYRRFKSDHFSEYDRVCQELTQLISLDPWLINPLFTRCEEVDFMKREGEDCMVEQSQHLLDQIQKKYDEYHIKDKPYVVIKADAGTYGMGVLSIHDPSEIRKLNRKKRSDMMMAKGNRPIQQVIIQEGIYTFEIWNDAVAEPVVYLLGQYVIGGFYRVHTGRGVSDNLNSPGMQFEPLPFIKACNIPEVGGKQGGKCANRFYVYGVIARLALLAAAREQAAILKRG